MLRIANLLAQQMNEAGILPGQEHLNPAYTESNGMAFLCYAFDDAGQPVLGLRTCTMDKVGHMWTVWDEHGSQCAYVEHDGNAWKVI